VITQITDRTLSEKGEWIGRRDVEAIKGALKPSAYVARAYKYSLQNHGIPPDWAKKLDNSHWLFLESYIHADAKKNLESISVHDAAQMLGATRRAIQDWADQGVIPVLGGENREKGEERRIPREAFIREIPQLRKRLETAAVLARKLKHGNQIPEELLQELQTRKMRRSPSTRHRDHATRSQSNVVQSSANVTLKSFVESPHDEKDVRLRALRARSATALESKLRAAVETTPESAAEDRTIERVRTRTIKEKSAAALEVKLRTAAESAAEKQMEQRAMLLAERVQDQMFEEDFSMRRAAIMFIWEAISRGIPAKIRIKISKKIFGE